ncbi:MAG: DUF4097 family beta strand repeat-containing protein [Bacteroidota bacterium]
MKNVLLSFCLGLLILSGAYGQKTIERTFDGIEEIDVSLGSGDASFVKGSSDQVKLVLRHTFDDYNPTIEKRGDRLFIREERNNGNWNRRGDASWEFTVPDGMELEFNTGSGDVEIDGLTMEISVNSGSGDYDLSKVDGEFKMNTGSGDFTIRDSRGEYRINTGSGDIDIRGMVGEIDGNTGSGDIEIDAITLAGPSGLNSGSGDVEVSLASGLDHDLSINSGSGDATLDFDGNPIEGLIVMQVSKRRGRIVAPFAFDKEEEIDNGGSSPTIRKTAQIGDKDVKIRVGSGSGTAEIEK